MAWTSHGHQIPGTTVSPNRPDKVMRCGGPGRCSVCSFEVANGLDPVPSAGLAMANLGFRLEQHSESTLPKVLRALIASGLTEEQAINAIREMQNDGILFREKAD